MPNFHIRARNAHHLTRSSEKDYTDADEALTEGVVAATMMVAEDIKLGTKVASVEVSIFDADDEVVARTVVTLAVAPMLIG